MKFSASDERFVGRALALAKRGAGKTSPNPMVGAVLVRNGRIIGDGWHKKAGGPHAEVNALRRGNARGATLYVTLEPCCTHGRTPPCTDAIIAAGVKRVVVAALDPNPKHNGRGLRALKRAGIRVEAGLLAEEAAHLNEAFNKWIVTGLPLVIAKAAMSLDGKIATRTGDSKWITSEAARRYGHKVRAQVDAIVVGAGTVIADDPQLTVRHGVRGRQPLRVVVDSRGRCPLKAKLFSDKYRSRTLVVTSQQLKAKWRRALSGRGVGVAMLPARGGHVSMRAVMKLLGHREVTSVLIEGGGGLPGAVFDAGLVDKVLFFYAPLVIGGAEATTPVQGRGTAKVASAWRFTRNCQWRKISATEMMFEGYRESK